MGRNNIHSEGLVRGWGGIRVKIGLRVRSEASGGSMWRQSGDNEGKDKSGSGGYDLTGV